MANIAEGFVRRSNKEFVQFLFIAMSSSSEVQSHLYIAVDQGYLSKDEFELIYAQADKAGRIISGLIKYLRTKQTNPTKSIRPTKQTLFDGMPFGLGRVTKRLYAISLRTRVLSRYCRRSSV